ncbi:hypothetical protein [Paenibacillus sp. P46E]|uniref:hypothetical protein n=1 Tax=Paenibacillus sp. P46E TaxID=1349436 RepID=UPI00093B6CB6|nr:hypothetical protein [Paenibacillus sp. P46E]OKP98952.1 hypothetical protein A3849_07130 [Paenibacillus sp. P46E]
MIIWATLFAIAAGVVLSVFLGSYGFLVLLAVAFGMVTSTYVRTKEIHSDLQIIKEKLGITDEGETGLSNEEIEAELEREYLDQGKTVD